MFGIVHDSPMFFSISLFDVQPPSYNVLFINTPPEKHDVDPVILMRLKRAWGPKGSTVATTLAPRATRATRAHGSVSIFGFGFGFEFEFSLAHYYMVDAHRLQAHSIYFILWYGKKQVLGMMMSFSIHFVFSSSHTLRFNFCLLFLYVYNIQNAVCS